ncbi:hypothetical protein C9994_16790 [Marivirga lumbricoides]|uniref:Uncharacterized protein n=1 Tax=Marivirga lumbricoides TaxID=1046115 RepID=A0A2T4DAC0_9BACT|nr:hypothetical protein C9994_16790 [Marivirga lumbricoides]
MNNIIFGSYPEIHHSYYKGLTDSILIQYPNRTKIDFKNLSSSQRNSLVIIYWNKFQSDFNNSIDFDEVSINKKTKSFFFTLHFNLNGHLEYLFYNWNKYPDNNDSFNKKFIQFASQYDFSGFPQGIKWSQCGTFTYKNGKPKK